MLILLEQNTKNHLQIWSLQNSDMMFTLSMNARIQKMIVSLQLPNNETVITKTEITIQCNVVALFIF